MKWPNFLKFKKPEWKIKLPTFFKRSLSFYGAWKKFISQIPPDSRSLIKSYQHFIVLGGEKTGKTDLIHSLIDQSQDLYPFDTTYTHVPGVQFYIGPRQIIEEISFSTLENRSIKGRKQIIRLWKKLYARNVPLVVVTYDCSSGSNTDLRELNKLAQFIAGKVSLLTEISKKQIKLRIALTHLDKIPGYLEFARFLKQQNLNFTIPLSSNFESNMLSAHLKSFAEEHLSLILTSVSYADHAKILHFFKEMPLIFPLVEEFLRALMSRVSFKNVVELDYLSLTSHQEGSSAFSVFQWTKTPGTTLFFRYPMLKHQIGASLAYIGIGALILNSYSHLRNELLYVKKGVELLDLLQFPTFDEQIIAKHEQFKNQTSNRFLAVIPPYFFARQLSTAKEHLAHRIRKHMIEPAFRKTILENKGEFKYLYFLGLINSVSDNHIGKFIYKNADAWGKVLGLDKNLIRTYISCASKPIPSSLFTESKASPFLPLTSLDPWFSFLKKVKDITDQPIFIEQPFENDEVVKETEKLLTAVSRLRADSLIFAIATLLDEAGIKENENIKTIHWIGENIDALENFLLFIKQTSIPKLNVQGMNLIQFFGKLKEISLLSGAENELYNFALRGQLFSFDSTKWTNHIVVHNIEQTIQEYMAVNSETQGAIFFNNTLEIPEPSLAPFQQQGTIFKAQLNIPGRYSRADFEKKVRSPSEKLVSFIESLPINLEEKKRFSNFLTREAINYIKNYQSKYAKFFDAYDVETDSLKGVKKLLGELAKPTSSFYDFLRTIQQQTSVFSEPILCVKNPEELNEFAFLDKLLQHKDGVAPISEYQHLMGQLLEALEKPSLENSHLSPLAQLSLTILQNKPDSYGLKLQECLDQIGIPERFQSPFNKPLFLVYQLGLQELKQNIENLWTSEFYPKLQALLSKFPFEPQETTTATLEELEELLHPHSPFYQKLSDSVSILSVQKEGKWYPVQESVVRLDDHIYIELNRISYITHLLWDAEGKPRPLTLKISSVPFVTGTEHHIPALCYIVTGEESMYNFNQNPSWQTLSIEWWKPDSTYIGMELLNKITNTKSYRNLQGPASPWSFFSLLKKGKEAQENIWEWNLSGKSGQDGRIVSFRFEQSPHKIFQPSEQL